MDNAEKTQSQTIPTTGIKTLEEKKRGLSKKAKEKVSTESKYIPAGRYPRTNRANHKATMVSPKSRAMVTPNQRTLLLLNTDSPLRMPRLPGEYHAENKPDQTLPPDGCQEQ